MLGSEIPHGPDSVRLDHARHVKELGRHSWPRDLNSLKQDLTRRMDGALETLRREFAGLRTGRASPALLEPVRVPAYGTEMPLDQVGTIGTPEPRMLTVQVWDNAAVSAPSRRRYPRLPASASIRPPTASWCACRSRS